MYGYPIEEAAGVALEIGREFDKDFDEIRYICFSDKDFEIYNKVWEELS